MSSLVGNLGSIHSVGVCFPLELSHEPASQGTSFPWNHNEYIVVNYSFHPVLHYQNKP